MVREKVIGDRDGFLLIGGMIALFALIPLLWRAITPSARIERFEMLSPGADGCRVEAWVSGKPGDELMRLFDARKHRLPIYRQTIIRHPRGNSTRIPDTVRSTSGTCRVARYRLLIEGREADIVTVPGVF
jgi:hypothetical protein